MINAVVIWLLNQNALSKVAYNHLSVNEPVLGSGLSPFQFLLVSVLHQWKKMNLEDNPP